MKNTIKLILAFLLICNIANNLDAQTTHNYLILDLAALNPNEKITINKNLSFEGIIIKNKIPGRIYNLSISHQRQEIPELPIDVSGVTALVKDSSLPCDRTKNILHQITKLLDINNPKSDSVSEKQIPLLLKELESVAKQESCNDLNIMYQINQLLDLCQYVINEKLSIESGMKTTITISRDDKVWTWEIAGEQVGKWVMTYGFGFSSSAFEPPSYHVKQFNDTVFQIRKNEKPDVLDLRYVPAIFYSFLPENKRNSSFNWSITSGLGFDLSAPVVFFGGGFMYYQNIGVNIGIAFQQQDKLKPQYTVDEILKTSLEKDQLHDPIYRPNFFVAINFRFGENPFKAKTASNNTPKEE